MKFRKKPVVIDAVQFDPAKGHPVVCKGWKADTGQIIVTKDAVLGYDTKVSVIFTLEGWHEVTEGDWIICGINGEFYPVKPDIFEKTYEKV